MTSWLETFRHHVASWLMILLTVVFILSVPSNRAYAQDGGARTAADFADQSLGQQFQNYMHFVQVGRFDVADKLFGDNLVNRPELNPMTPEGAETLIAATEARDDTNETLLRLINHSTIGENARRLLDLIREAHEIKWKDPQRILANIELLAGDPMQWKVGLERLQESGEYAVPWMLGVLSDPRSERLHPFVIRALPKLGKRAINPLLAGLELENESVRQVVIRALGKIGYPQALPYLQAIAQSASEPVSIRSIAEEALRDLVLADKKVLEARASATFRDLAEQYYAAVESLRPDPRLEPWANVWKVREGAKPGEDQLTPIKVPIAIYNLVSCMDCCKRSLVLEGDQAGTLALWLAANFRREARLGLNVQSEETIDATALDRTRPENFPRSIYFARTAGPHCCQIVLRRALADRDRMVALGAIAALNVTAGAAGLTTPEDPSGTSLGEALYFPDLLVRVEAALALGRALPTESFRGAAEVVPVLASVVTPADRSFFLVVDPEPASRHVMLEGLSGTGAEVIAAEGLTQGLSQARQRFTHLDGLFLASDVKLPAVIESLRTIGADDRFGLAPVVILIKEGDNFERIVRQLQAGPAGLGSVFVLRDSERQVDPKLPEQALAERQLVAERIGHPILPIEVQESLALRAINVLAGIAQSRSPVFDARVAIPALVATLGTIDTEPLREASIWSLSWMDSADAQRAVATVAMGESESETLRKIAFSALAESARRFGSQLDNDLMDRLVDQAIGEPNLELRTAASQAMGAMNAPIERTAEIVTSY